MKCCCLLILFHLFALAGIAQNTIGLPRLINYNKNDYLAGTQTWDIKQDSRGIMYFANNEGMLVYDGSHWKIYPLPNKTIVRALAIDNDNRIYAGGQDEIGYFSPAPNGQLIYTSLKDILPKSQNKLADVWKIEIFKGGVFFQASDRILEYRNGSIKVYPTREAWLYLRKVGDQLYAQDKSTGLLRLHNQEWLPAVTSGSLGKVEISGMAKISADSLLITTEYNGLYLLYKDAILTSLPDPEGAFTNKRITTSEQINPTELVAGTTTEGCMVMDFKGHVIQKIARTEGLQNNNVLSVFLDKDRNLWAGLNNGISFIAYNAAIKYIAPNKNNEVSGYSTRIFNRQLYIGTSDGAYSVPLTGSGDLSFSKGEFKRIPESRGEVWRLDEVNRHILMGQHTGCYVIENNTARSLIDGIGTWIFKPVSSVYPVHKILVGTYSGVELLESGGEAFTGKGKLDGIQESLRFLEIDNDNTIWASHPYRGVYRLQLSDDGKSITPQLYTDKDGLPSALGNYVFKIRNRVVFGTTRGVYEYDAASKKFVPSAFLKPVFGTMEIRYLNEDADENIWFCSGKQMGVASFHQTSSDKSSGITWFPELNGKILLGFENIYPYDKQNVFIGSDRGMIHLNYEKYISGKQQVTVLLHQVRASGKQDSVIFGGYQPLQQQSAIRWPRKDNAFHFEYSSPAYGLQNNIEYSYQLEGYDPQWSAWSLKSEKDYTNLPDGRYTFNVKAHDNLGNESAVVSYSFVVSPAWYKTVWAYIIYALLFGGLLYFLQEWQQKKLHLQQRRFDEEQKRLKYIHQLEMEKSEKEIMKLQNEKMASEITYKNNALADASMHLVERNDALVKVKEMLEDIYKKNNKSTEIKNVLSLLNDAEKNDANWEQFAKHFDEINNDFLKKLKARFPTLSNSDLKVCAYLQLKLSTKEIARLMAISVRGVEIRRYRLRKKLNLTTDQSMTDFLNAV
ncbi:MAG TPA: triple tyrosine motif-containing protein [Chitinophaga sp.]|uniref:triple tyrosine motif-containing protein n=1 Tax=Chitinophaga sp. TaxID=1869181 RepID=UPI002C2A0C06|nr:triple tyrosine motif-containing protein [Chitinophaga sp.]HVI47065.1 triple tyrosine motif-containing protein [Chitinophaga sp.]